MTERDPVYTMLPTVRYFVGALLGFSIAFGQAPELGPGQNIDRAIAAGETHWYSLELKSGQYCHVLLEQHSTDLKIEVRDPAGKEVARIDGFERGKESVSFRAAMAGFTRLGVSGAKKGNYSLAWRVIPNPSAVDEMRANAERHSTEAKRLREQGQASSLRASLDEGTKALALWHDLQDRPAELATLIGLGDAHHALSEYGKAREVFQQALPISRELEDHQGEGEILNDLGMGFFREGMIEQALDSMNQSSSIWDRFSFPYEQAATSSNLGILNYQIGEWQAALSDYLKALEKFRSLGDRRGEAVTLHNIGVAYNALGQGRAALPYLDDALAILKETTDKASTGRTHGVMGRIYLSLGEKGKALDSQEQALRLARATGDVRSEAEALNSIGMVQEANGDHVHARQNYDEASTKSRSINDRRGEAVALQNVGMADAAADRIAEALDLLARSLDLHMSTNATDAAAQVLYSMAALERKRGRIDAAQVDIEKCLDFIESLRIRVAGQSFRTSYFASKQDYYELYVSLLMQKKDDAGALGAAERTHGRSLMELLDDIGRQIHTGIDPRLLDRQRALQRQLNFRAAQRNAPPDVFPRLLANLEAVESEVRASSPRYASLMNPQPLSAGEIQQEVLDPQTLLLEYSIGRESSYLWAVSRTTMKSYRLPGGSEINRTVRQFLDLVAKRPRGPTQEWRGAALALSRMLLSPAAAQLGTRRLLIVPDGVLQYVPWAALPAPGRPNAFLLQEHEIISSPSASIIAVLRRELAGRRPAPKSLTVLADPVFRADDPRVTAVPASSNGSGLAPFPRLPFTRVEAAGIRAVAPRDADVHLDFAARKETLIGPAMRQYRTIHIASHVVVDDVHPELSAIVLTLVDSQGTKVDGFVRLHEIYNLTLPADLIVLSACQSGLGTEVRGEGVVGLTRGFMYAGAARTIMSLWEVDDAATAELMSRFYQNLYQRNLHPVAALRSAQLTILREKRWESPFYWASYAFQGEWR